MAKLAFRDKANAVMRIWDNELLRLSVNPLDAAGV